MNLFEEQCKYVAARLATAPEVDVGEWQSIRGDIPQAKTIEVEDLVLGIPVPQSVKELQELVHPNLPWAEDHFLERVSGHPLNPPPSSAWWPHAQRNNAEFKTDEKFSHTYPERFWPKFAEVLEGGPNLGIRYPLGDLDDVLHLLQDHPHTRQAYLPVWFPEDTGAVGGQRVPCTLGYHFMIRNGHMKIVYFMRSCDFFRHFNDDVYMAARLCQWMCDQLEDVVPDRLMMYVSSMHIFSVERARVQLMS